MYLVKDFLKMKRANFLFPVMDKSSRSINIRV